MRIVLRINRANKMRSDYLNFAFFFLYIYFMFSLWFLSISTAVTSVLTAVLILFYMWIEKKKIVLKKVPLLTMCFMIGLIMLSGIVNRCIGVFEISAIIQIFIAMLLVCAFTKVKFEKHYSDVMCLIAVFSIICFLCGLLLPSFVVSFPYITTTKWIGDAIDMNLRNLFISVVNLNTIYPRNWGIFYEPGMFAFFLNVAIYFTLIELNEKNIRKIIILTIAQITTMSTNGLFSLVLIYFLYFIRRNSYRNFVDYSTHNSESIEKSTKRFLMLFFVVALIAVIFFFIKMPDRLDFFIGKIRELNSSSTFGSGYERMEAIRIAVEAVCKNPIFGLTATGVGELANGRITTFTPIQWFATYGLVYGLFCNFAFWLYGYDKEDKTIANILKSLTLFSMVISQNMTTNGIVLAMIFYNVGKRLIRRI